jgi:hypothetical protein
MDTADLKHLYDPVTSKDDGGKQIMSQQGDLATDGLQIPAVTMTNVPLKPVEW